MDSFSAFFAAVFPSLPLRCVSTHRMRSSLTNFCTGPWQSSRREPASCMRPTKERMAPLRRCRSLSGGCAVSSMSHSILRLDRRRLVCSTASSFTACTPGPASPAASAAATASASAPAVASAAASASAPAVASAAASARWWRRSRLLEKKPSSRATARALLDAPFPRSEQQSSFASAASASMLIGPCSVSRSAATHRCKNSNWSLRSAIWTLVLLRSLTLSTAPPRNSDGVAHSSCRHIALAGRPGGCQSTRESRLPKWKSN